jgi:hypothetical protein
MDAILDKIRKLLALANNNDNEHQAAAATAKAMELMERHNLDLSMLSAQKPDGTRDDRKLKGGLYGWQRKIWEASAKLNFCMYWSIKGLAAGSSYEHRILGKQVNVVSTQIMAEYLQNTIERMAKAQAKATDTNVFARPMIAYREGIAARLIERLEDLRRQRMEEEQRKKDAWANQHSTGTSLTLVDVAHAEEDYNNDYVNGWEPGTSARMRAESEARSAAYRREREEKKAEHERRYAADPAYAAEYDRLAAEQTAANEKWWADYLKKQAKKPEPKPRYRAMTPEEQRARLSTFTDGYYDGDKVGLDQQVANNKRAKLA